MTNLDYFTAMYNYQQSEEPSLQIKILRTPIVTIQEDFNALQFNVEVVDKSKSLPFKPQNPHISFIYKYAQEITLEEIKDVINKLDFDKTYKFNNYKLMCCNGHFKEWYEVNHSK